jgi:hypothetical protein
VSSHTAAPASSASRGRTRDAHGRFSGSNNHQWRSPLPRPTPRECRYITDAEVLERVAQVLDVELVADLDKRRLRRLNSVVNRYKLERKALAATKTAERYTSRDQVAVSLYGPDVDLNSVKRQMRRLEAILELAGLLEVRVLRGDQGEDRGLVIRLLDPLEGLEPDDALAELAVDGRRAEAVLAPRPETPRRSPTPAPPPLLPTAERPGPLRRRPRRLGPPARPLRAPNRNCHPWELTAWDIRDYVPIPGRSSKERKRRERAARRRRRRRRARGDGRGFVFGRRDRRPRRPSSGAAALEPFDRHERATRSRRRPGSGPLGRAQSVPTDCIERARAGAAPRGRSPRSSALLDRRRDLRGRLRRRGRAALLGRPHPRRRELEPTRSPGRYRPIGPRWAERLEVACRQIDRLEGPGAGIAALVDDVVGWRPGDGAPRGAQHNRTDAGRHRGDVTVHTTDPGWPVSLAYFIRRLQITARARRRDQDPRRRLRSLDWRIRQERGELTPWGQTKAKARRQLRQERDYFVRLEELEADDQAAAPAPRPRRRRAPLLVTQRQHFPTRKTA